jgi:hypothetical protein
MKIRMIGFVAVLIALVASTEARAIVPPSGGAPKAPYNELLDPAKYVTVSLSNLKDIRLSIKASSLSYVAASISADPSASRTGRTAKVITRGKPCSTGPSPAALERCRIVFDELTNTVPATAWVEPFAMQTELSARYLVATMGGRAWTLDPSSAAGRKDFGRIDTATEVAWVSRSTLVRKQKGGYLYLERKMINECPRETQSRAMFINTATGAVSVRVEGPVESAGFCT